MRLGSSELHWFRLSARSRLEIADAMATLLLGVVLCAALLAFSAFQLGAADWAPEVHGLSEEGKYFVSLSLAGMRVHEVESGKEIDRIQRGIQKAFEQKQTKETKKRV